jgi:hypothetical protein
MILIGLFVLIVAAGWPGVRHYNHTGYALIQVLKRANR